MTDSRNSRIIGAVFMSVVAASLCSGSFYLLLVVASFFVVMPLEAQSGSIVGSVLAVIFIATFAVTLRKIARKNKPSHRQ